MSASYKPPYTDYPVYAVLEDLYLRAGGKVEYIDYYELMNPEEKNPRLAEIEPEAFTSCIACYNSITNILKMPDSDSPFEDILPALCSYAEERTENELFSEITRLFAHEMAHFLLCDFITERQYVLPQFMMGHHSFSEGMADTLAGALYELARRIADNEKKPLQAP